MEASSSCHECHSMLLLDLLGNSQLASLHVLFIFGFGPVLCSAYFSLITSDSSWGAIFNVTDSTGVDHEQGKYLTHWMISITPSCFFNLYNTAQNEITHWKNNQVDLVQRKMRKPLSN